MNWSASAEAEGSKGKDRNVPNTCKYMNGLGLEEVNHIHAWCLV